MHQNSIQNTDAINERLFEHALKQNVEVIIQIHTKHIISKY